ncbi:transglycosylase SLT domain-containing protein [Desulfovibrio sp. OttesenSCG-928-C06]|nr:transglycosylase SLT domain-containing protein [Desulfovibrio sp. OttesenSCG-928-C06]
MNLLSRKLSNYAGALLIAAILVFLAALFGSAWNKMERSPRIYKYNAYNEVQPRPSSGLPLLKVVLPYERRLARASSPFGPGMDEELLGQFASAYKYEVRIFYARNYKDALDMLKVNKCDLVIGFGGEPSKERDYIAQSPVYASFYPVQVSASGSASHVYSTVLSNGLRGVSYTDGSPDTILLDPHTYSILVPMHDDLKIKGSLSQSVGYRWFWNTANFDLSARMLHFWNSREREKIVAELRERYYGFMPKKAKHQDLRDLALVVSEKMSQYSDAIAKASAESGIDPLLLAAVIFQESRFDPSATSFTGVRGIMQLTTDTAAMLNVDRLDPEECIIGGARYLKMINDSLGELDISEWDRWCLALAAYNQGPANLRNALRLADAQGKGKSWPEMRKVYRSLQNSDRASKNFRSGEALAYVENVRYYYYVMSRLATVASREKKDFTPLLLLTSAE